MGVDLHTVGNHNFTFESCFLHEVADEVLYRLNKISFSNREFLRLWRLTWKQNDPIAIREINTTISWKLTSSYYDFNPQTKRDEKRHLSFTGIYGLRITIYDKSIYISEPHIRYMHWFDRENELFRNEWRKYFKAIVTAFGGDRVIYLPDCTYLDNILDHAHSFTKIEKRLKKKYGNPIVDFESIYQIIDDELAPYGGYSPFAIIGNWYFIDDFSIPLNTNYPIEELLPEPTEYDNMGSFDLKKCENYTYLFDIFYTKEYMLHKKENDQLYFCHIAYRDDLLVIRRGIVGSKGDLELTIDREMPFKFNEIYYKIREENYTSILGENYEIEYDDDTVNQDTFFKFLEKLRFHILLNGIGLINVEYLTSLAIVNKKIFLNTLSCLIEKENETSYFEVVKWYNDKVIFKNR